MVSAHPRLAAKSFPLRLLDLFRHLGRMALDPRFVARTALKQDFLKAVLANESAVQNALTVRMAGDGQVDDPRLLRFKTEFDAFAAQTASTGERLSVNWADRYPCLDDRTSTTPFDRHYVYHPAWAARILARTRPDKHVDISSTIAFCSILSAFVPTEFYDFRPADLSLDGLYCGAADLTRLPFESDSVRSLSCMHVLEHIGLGRYGDPLNVDGDLKAIAELVRVVAPGGDLLVATPVGKPRVQFNAHRVYDHEDFARAFHPLELVEFTLIEEAGSGGLIVSPSSEHVRSQSYACGCFWLRKPLS